MISGCHYQYCFMTNAFRFHPGIKIKKRICTDDKIILCVRIRFIQLFQSQVSIRITFLMHLDQRQLKVRIILYGKTDHFHTLFISRSALTVPFMRWISAGHKQNLIKFKLFIGFFSQDQMPHMNGIKSTTHDSYFLCCFAHL